MRFVYIRLISDAHIKIFIKPNKYKSKEILDKSEVSLTIKDLTFPDFHKQYPACLVAHAFKQVAFIIGNFPF